MELTFQDGLVGLRIDSGPLGEPRVGLSRQHGTDLIRNRSGDFPVKADGNRSQRVGRREVVGRCACRGAHGVARGQAGIHQQGDKPASTSRASSSCMENPARTRGTINAVGRKIAD